MPMQIPRDDDTNRNWLLSDLIAAVEHGSFREAREALRRSFEQKNAACVLQAVLEDLADERGDDPATLKLLSYISERAHSDAGSAECWPRGGLGHDDLSWLPIVHVSSVRLSPDGAFVERMALDEALLLRHLSEHSWCVLRLDVLPGAADGAAVLAGALEHARQESGRFFHELPEQRKRELTELPGYSALNLKP
jgi:hypothetical protein